MQQLNGLGHGRNSGRHQGRQPGELNVMLDDAVGEDLRIHVATEVVHLVAVVLEQHLYDVFAYVVDVAFNRGNRDVSLGGHVMPIEVKADTQGGMKSLWNMMREKNLSNAYRISLENLGQFDYCDVEAENAIRHVQICPLYAISQIK